MRKSVEVEEDRRGELEESTAPQIPHSRTAGGAGSIEAALFTRHQLDQLYDEGRGPTIRLIESLLDYIEELKHDPSNRQQRQ